MYAMVELNQAGGINEVFSPFTQIADGNLEKAMKERKYLNDGEKLEVGKWYRKPNGTAAMVRETTTDLTKML